MLSTDDFSGIVSRYRRYIPVVVAIIVAVVALAIVVTLLMQPLYTATATVVYAPEKQIVAPTAADSQAPASDAQDQAVDTQVAVLTSPDLALRVETTLGLDTDPEFLKATKDLKFALGEPADQRMREVRDTIAAALAKLLKVKRVGQTLLIGVDFTSASPVKAARIANTFVQVYLDQQVEQKIKQGNASSAMVKSQMNGLRAQVQEADAAVQAYRVAHNLLNVSSSPSAGPETASQTTIVQQEVVALNDQLAVSRADAAGAKARLQSAQKQMRGGGSGETVGAAIESPVIALLREQYADASRRVADLRTTHGPEYPELVAAQSQRAEIENQIHEQVTRIMSSLQSDADAAQQRVSSLDGDLSAAKGQIAAGSVASVQLNDLQRTADAARSQYEAFLASANTLQGQNAVARADARVSAPAGVPLEPSSPIMILNVFLGLVIGVGLGVATAFVLDRWNANITSLEDVENRLGLPYLGAAPTVKSSIDKPATTDPILAVIKHPLSSFAEGFRNLGASLFYSPSGQAVKVVAITSALPKEGKTATSICLSRVMALAGSSVVLVDCDLRRRSATQSLLPHAESGLMEVLSAKALLDAVLYRDEATGAFFLPLAGVAHPTESPFRTQAMTDLLAVLRERFDIVLLDTAPILAVVDTRILSTKVDAVLMLVRWRSTPAKAVRAALHMLNSVGGRVTGAALTMVDLKAQTQSGYGDPSGYYKDIKSYYSS